MNCYTGTNVRISIESPSNFIQAAGKKPSPVARLAFEGRGRREKQWEAGQHRTNHGGWKNKHAGINPALGWVLDASHKNDRQRPS